VAEGVEDRLRALGYELPAVPQLAGSSVPAIRAHALLFTAGQLPSKEGQLPYTGKVGREVSVEDVASAEGFNGQPEVMNGASDLIGELFGEKGLHARTPAGVVELP
jgi:enamine deaminase RidA (YjgF/YER057c/UK114 family)